jgi:hypothetical protein
MRCDQRSILSSLPVVATLAIIQCMSTELGLKN